MNLHHNFLDHLSGFFGRGMDLGLSGDSEVRDLIISWLVISFCFSAGDLFYPRTLLITLPLALATVGLGFIGHELAHRYVALRLGYYAKYVMWRMGLLLALLLALASNGQVIFAAPGAVYIVPKVRRILYGFETVFRDRRGEGLIAVSGPLTNLGIAFAFYLLTDLGGILGLLGWWVYRTNLWLAAFNMIPFPPMDGSKVLRWNKIVWALTGLTPWLLIYLL